MTDVMKKATRHQLLYYIILYYYKLHQKRTQILYKNHGNLDSVCGLTSPPSRAWTKALLSLLQERTVSVLPSLNRRVMDAS